MPIRFGENAGASRLGAVLRSQRGLSLVEVLVAGAILAIVSVVMVSMLYTAVGVSKKSADLSAADQQLTSSAAQGTADATTDATTSGLSITLKGAGESGEDITIDGLTLNTYHSDAGGDNRELSTFGLADEVGE
ncbi:MAG: type II secretion system GspH family protein [Coriobacteriales bacterium]|jgi:prepilin-type N-terminal cleavage/methylation domain-containing protein|nr:type II secretion system GspH family protein [Coriobacteriales bacterium]